MTQSSSLEKILSISRMMIKLSPCFPMPQIIAGKDFLGQSKGKELLAHSFILHHDHTP
jgi:hypothetical protein